jgi:hypothetical protein
MYIIQGIVFIHKTMFKGQGPMLDLTIMGYLEMMGASIYKAYFRLKNSYYLLSCVCEQGLLLDHTIMGYLINDKNIELNL